METQLSIPRQLDLFEKTPSSEDGQPERAKATPAEVMKLLMDWGRALKEERERLEPDPPTPRRSSPAAGASAGEPGPASEPPR